MTHKCQCNDISCVECHGDCTEEAILQVYWIDWENEYTKFCRGCAENAIDTGLFHPITQPLDKGGKNNG